MTRTFDILGYETGSAMELHLDVEAKSGRAFCWTLEVSWREDEWIIQSRLSEMGTEGGELLHEFPARIALSVAEIVAELKNAVAALVASAESFDFEHPAERRGRC